MEKRKCTDLFTEMTPAKYPGRVRLLDYPLALLPRRYVPFPSYLPLTSINVTQSHTILDKK